MEVGKFVLAKNVLFPLATLGALVVFQPPYHVALLMIMEAAVPPVTAVVTAVPILTERAGGNRHLVNQFMLVSFALSLLSIPLVMGLFGMFFRP